MSTLPAALPDGSKLLHIGMPKTGTTTLQHALWKARADLEAAGAHNVSRRVHERKVAITAADNIRGYWAPQHKRWESLAREFRTSGERCTFWSSESLSLASPERIHALREELGPATIVTTIRAFAPQLASRWQQGLRRGERLPLEDWLKVRFAEEPPGGDGAGFVPGQALRRLNPRRVLQDWGSVFGEENLVFVILAPNDHEWLLRAFEALLGVGQVLELPKSQNLSMPYPEAELLRQFSIAYHEHGGRHGTWMSTVGDSRRLRLRKVLEAAERHPIRVPRWAAEKANEYVAEWVDALESSGATVVGDVAHLAARPEDHAEQLEVPQTIDVASAGRMFDAYFRVGLRGVPKPKAPAREPASLDTVTSRALVGEIARRARGRLPGRP